MESEQECELLSASVYLVQTQLLTCLLMLGVSPGEAAQGKSSGSVVTVCLSSLSREMQRGDGEMCIQN